MRKLICVLLLWIALPGLVTADARLFFASGGALQSFDDGNDSINPVNLYLRIGLGINETIEVGAELSTTLIDDDVDASDFDVDTTLIFIKANLMLDSGLVLYGLVGQSSVEVTERRGSTTSNSDDTDVAYGFGVQFNRASGSAYMIDFISYYDDDEFDGVDSDSNLYSLNFGYASYF